MPNTTFSFYLTKEEYKEYLDREEEIRKRVQEAGNEALKKAINKGK